MDIHPPLYYWLLSLWAVPFGQGEAALRGFSVVLGTLMVWATWGLGRALGGRAVGLAAAALLAVSPLAVQYSQEVRMYALAGLLAAASSWAGLALLRALQDDGIGRRRIVAARRRVRAAGRRAALHPLLRHAGGGGAAGVRRPDGAARPGAGGSCRSGRLASGLAALLFLPWLPVALRQTGYYPGLGSPQPAWALVLDAVNVLSIGIATTRFGFRAGLAPFLGLAALGASSCTEPRALGERHAASPSPCAGGVGSRPAFVLGAIHRARAVG